MPTVHSTLQQLDEGRDIKEVRSAVADLIVHYLHELNGSLGYWEKVYFSYAIAVFSWNANSRNQPTTAWLRLCLVAVEKAMLPADRRNENFTSRDKQLEAITCEQLVEDINSLRKIGC